MSHVIREIAKAETARLSKAICEEPSSQSSSTQPGSMAHHDARRAIGAGETDDAEIGAIALLGMGQTGLPGSAGYPKVKILAHANATRDSATGLGEGWVKNR